MFRLQIRGETKMKECNPSLNQLRKYFLSIGDYGGAGQVDDILENYEFCKRVCVK